jgi:hypothetical protein
MDDFPSNLLLISYTIRSEIGNSIALQTFQGSENRTVPPTGDPIGHTRIAPYCIPVTARDT